MASGVALRLLYCITREYSRRFGTFSEIKRDSFSSSLAQYLTASLHLIPVEHFDVGINSIGTMVTNTIDQC